MMQINSRIKQRSDTLQNWLSNDIVLLSGELAVVDCGAQVRFKVGDGTHKFSQLKFIDEDQLSTQVVYAHAISQGTQAHSTPFGLAAGWRLSANANYSQALGFKAQTLSSDDYSFVWNGDDQTYNILGSTYYQSHGKGTFNISPLSGTEGVWIGEQTLQQLLDAVDPMNVPIQVIKPANDNNLYLSVGVFADKEMSATAVIPPVDSRLSSSFFYCFSPNGNSSQWVECDENGFSRQSNNLPVIFDMPKALDALSADYKAYKRLYIKYSWYYISGLSTIFSDSYSTTLPAATEVGANAQDTVNKAEFYDLYQNVIPQTQAMADDGSYVLAYSTKYNTAPQLSSLSIALMEYDEHKTYRIEIQPSTSSHITFFTELANGNIELANALSSFNYIFKPDNRYIVEVKDEHVQIFNTAESSHTPEEIAKAYQIKIPLQMVKPASDFHLHLSIDLFTDMELSNSILSAPLDSKTSPELFYGFVPCGSESFWQQCSISGFSREFNNLPVMFNMPALFDAISTDVYQIEQLFTKYTWYYELSSDDTKVFSDWYTMALPGATETGANAQDSVNKTWFESLKQNVIVQSQQVSLSDVGAVDYYLAYSTKYNIITALVEDGDKIALMQYDLHKTYKIDLSTDVSNDVEVEFYLGLANNYIEYADDLNAESHTFKKNSHYVLEVRDGRIFVYDGDKVYASVESGSGGIYRYPLITAQLQNAGSSLSCAIQDHAVTTIEISSAATPIIVQLPPKYEDGARDFIIRVEISSSTAPSFTFSGLDENITFDSDNEEWYTLEPGLNLISFTETR